MDEFKYQQFKERQHKRAKEESAGGMEQVEMSDGSFVTEG